MKNLLIYIGPTKSFDKEHEDLTKIQIDNSLGLGWKVKDLVLVTNFNWEYRGVTASVLGGNYSALDGNRSSKIPVILNMDLGDDLYWFHDHDAFQLEPMRDPELGNAVAGFTDHGWSKKWNAGSFFFTQKAKDVFLWIYEYMNKRNTNEQDALTYMWEGNIDGVNNRYKLMNITYNIGIYYIDRNLKRAELPVKVAHFHPHKRRHLDLFRNMLPERLMTIFNKYGIK